MKMNYSNLLGSAKMWSRALMGVLALTMAFTMTSCDEDDDPSGGSVISAKSGVLVFNAGNQYSGIPGSLSMFSMNPVSGAMTLQNDLYQTANGQNIGSTLQDGVVYDGKIYVAVYGSNLYRVLDQETFTELGSYSFDEAWGAPRDVVTDGKDLYFSMYGGYVVKTPLGEGAPKFQAVQVGPNPEEMVITGGYLYVANSDGMNYGAGYVNGKSVSKIDLSSFTVEKTIPVGLNPCDLCADGLGGLFVVCMGNYWDVPALVYHILPSGQVSSKTVPATLISCAGGILYTINAPYGASTVEYKSYSVVDFSLLKDSFLASAPQSGDFPCAIEVDPSTGRLYITRYQDAGGYGSYSEEGTLSVYDRDGILLHEGIVGVGPADMQAF